MPHVSCLSLFWKKISLRGFWSVFFVNSVKIDDDDEIVDFENELKNETFYFSKLSDTVLHQGINVVAWPHRLSDQLTTYLELYIIYIVNC